MNMLGKHFYIANQTNEFRHVDDKLDVVYRFVIQHLKTELRQDLVNTFHHFHSSVQQLLPRVDHLK